MKLLNTVRQLTPVVKKDEIIKFLLIVKWQVQGQRNILQQIICKLTRS